MNNMIKKKIKTNISISNAEIINRIIAAQEELLQIIRIAVEKLDVKYNKRVKFNLELILERAVDQFYESYTPNMYRRKEGLYKAGEVTATDDEWSLRTGAEFIEVDYPAGTDYVFWNSFQNGYHGGAVDGPEHPEPGVPWYKAYGEWLRPATPGPSIEGLIEKQDPVGYIEQQEDNYEKELLSVIEPYVYNYLNTLKALSRR